MKPLSSHEEFRHLQPFFHFTIACMILTFPFCSKKPRKWNKKKKKGWMTTCILWVIWSCKEIRRSHHKSVDWVILIICQTGGVDSYHYQWHAKVYKTVCILDSLALLGNNECHNECSSYRNAWCISYWRRQTSSISRNKIIGEEQHFLASA